MSAESIKARNAARRARGEHRTYNVKAAAPPPPPAPAPLVPLHLLPECVHGGTDRDIIERCPTCAGGANHVRECEEFGRVTWEATGNPAVMSCRLCRTAGKGYRPAPDPRAIRPKVSPLDLPGTGRRFNASIVRAEQKLLFAYREGWDDARIRIGELGPDLQPLYSFPLDLKHPLCEGGQEDPRLFDYDGQTWLNFAGVRRTGKGVEVSQLLAPLTPTLAAERVVAPQLSGRSYPAEKNWSFLSQGGSLFCLYSVRPWRVLAFSESGAVVTGEYRGPQPPADAWAGWSIRGGASPVLVGYEFVMFFHGHRKTPNEKSPSGAWYDYAAGVLTFDAAPPFRFRRICPYPVWLADPRKESLNVTNDKSVIYPCGATFDGSRWLVSSGHQDAECVIGEFAKDEIETALRG